MPRRATSTSRSFSLCVHAPSSRSRSSGKLTHCDAQYIDEKLTDPQRENHAQLINDLNDNLLTYIGRNRFPSKGGREALEHVRGLSRIGPFTARTALESGLINGTCYRQDVLDSVLDPEAGGSDDHKLFGFYHYHKVIERAVEKYMKDAVEVGVVYLLGTIGDPGECVCPFRIARCEKGLLTHT